MSELEILASRLDSKAVSKVVGDWTATRSWLDSNASGTLLRALGSALAGNHVGAVVEFVLWANAKLDSKSETKRNESAEIPPEWGETLDLEQAEAVVAAFAFSEKITGSPQASNTRGSGGSYDLVDPEKRLGVGLGYDDVEDRFMPVYFTESDNLRDNALRYFNDIGVKATVHSVGVAQSTRPSSDHARSKAVDCNRHRPGRPLGYRPNDYGSLGIYVVFQTPSAGEMAGMLTARHVLKPVNSQKPHDLFSPIPPFVPVALGSHSIFDYVDGPALFHYSAADDPDKIINRVDIGLASLPHRPDDLSNFVPNPQSPKIAPMADESYVALTPTWTEPAFDPIELTKPFDIRDKSRLKNLFLNNRVYKFGATSGLTRGKIISFQIKSFRIKMPNNWNYLFGNLMAVQSTLPGKRFSEPGDSGACVYSEDGEVLGTIIGGGPELSYVSPLTDGLEALDKYRCSILTQERLATLP